MTKPLHVIVGAGLGGLFTALKLINKGVSPEFIVLIDPRAGQYTRPGHLNSKTFTIVQSSTGIHTGSHSNARHIKELERMMYEKLRGHKVSFVCEQFINLQPQTESQIKAVITQKKDGTQGIYPTNYVFDCSGKDAHVVAAVNRHLQEPAFKSTLLVDINPITDHLIAQVLIPEYALLNDFSERNEPKVVPDHYRQAKAQKNIEIREQLQALNWSYETFPSFYTFPQQGTNKVCLYMETPPDLPKARQPAWIKLLLNIYSNGKVNNYKELNPSIMYREKPRIVGFKSIPHLLSKVVFQSGDWPVVIAGFDALKGFDYRLANGADSGIKCCELTLNEVTVREGMIQDINSDAVEKNVFEWIDGAFKNNLNYRLKSRQTAIEKGHEYFSELYEKAAVSLGASEYAKKQKYQLTAGNLAYKAATEKFPTLASRDKSSVTSVEQLSKCLGLYLRAGRHVPPNDTAIHYDINTKLQSLIGELRVEIATFKIEDVLSTSSTNITLLKSVLDSLKKNFEQLDGTFAHRSVLRAVDEFLAKINVSNRVSQQGTINDIFSLLLLSRRLGFERNPGAPSFFSSGSGREQLDEVDQWMILSSLLMGNNQNNEPEQRTLRFSF